MGAAKLGYGILDAVHVEHCQTLEAAGVRLAEDGEPIVVGAEDGGEEVGGRE